LPGRPDPILGGNAQINLGKGESATFTISARADGAGPAQDTATATADNATTVEAPLTTTILPGPPPLDVVKTPTDESIVVGGVTSYTITVHNPRTVPAMNVKASTAASGRGIPCSPATRS